MPSDGKPNGRFELPALAPINFNLTEGTDIPRPPPSPVEEAPPPPPPAAVEKPVQQTISTNITSGTNEPSTPVDRGRRESIPPSSPASSRRPSSIRRFLSRKSLNANYTNGTNTNDDLNDDLHGKRPESPSSFMNDGPPALKKAKSGSWFSRLGGGSRNKRASVIYETPKKEDATRTPEKKGPPPPKLPELSADVQAAGGGSLGADDMFKNIK